MTLPELHVNITCIMTLPELHVNITCIMTLPELQPYLLYDTARMTALPAL